MMVWLVVMVGFGWFIRKRRAEKAQARLFETPGMGVSTPFRPQAASMQPVVAQPVAQPGHGEMQVQVPPGSAPGTLLQVQTPAGLMQVAVPDGCAPGSTFIIRY